jgi:CARDB
MFGPRFTGVPHGSAVVGRCETFRALFALAPTDFNNAIVNDVPFAVLLSYCDGTVDLKGVHYYDNARYSKPGDLTPKHTLLVMGANHNYYNPVWPLFVGAESEPWDLDDGLNAGVGCFPGWLPEWPDFRLLDYEQRATAIAYVTGFFRAYVGGETVFASLFKGDISPPPSAGRATIYPAYHPPDSSAERRDLNRVLTSSDLTTNMLGGSVTHSGLTPYDLCGGGFPSCDGRTWHAIVQLRVGWSAVAATYTNSLPPGSGDVSGFQVFQFRAAVNVEDPRNTLGVAQDFTVRLTDGTGAFADTTVSAHSDALFYPPGFVEDWPAWTDVPRVVLNTVRIPLSVFATINLHDVRSVQFRFDQRSSGALLFTDLAFADSETPPGVPDLVETAVSNPPARVTIGGRFSVTDTVENQGVAGAAASTTRHYLSLDSVRQPGDVLLIGSRAVPVLGVGATSTGKVTVTVPGDTAAGAYFLLACADDTFTVLESHDGNNCRPSASTVQVSVFPPDLVESAVSNPPATVGFGQHFSVTDTVSNQGGGFAPASSTRYYLSPDATKSITDKLLGGARSVRLLEPGTSSTGSRTVNVKSSIAPGTYFLLACADDKNVVVEGDETNNCRASSTTVVVVAPDLIETSVTDPPASRAVGGTFTITDTVQNQGTAAAIASTTQYYLSLNIKKSKSDVRFSATRSVPALGIGASSGGSVVVTVPAGTPVASYFVLACADDTKSIPESNETNNCRASSQQVTITP